MKPSVGWRDRREKQIVSELRKLGGGWSVFLVEKRERRGCQT